MKKKEDLQKQVENLQGRLEILEEKLIGWHTKKEFNEKAYEIRMEAIDHYYKNFKK